MKNVTSKSTVFSKVTRRSLVIGLVMAAWVNFWPVYASLVLHSTRADHAHLSVALLIPYLFLLVGNLFLGQRGLSPSELLVVCCIGIVAACMQGEWLSNYFLEALTMPHYFASAENRWGELLLPHLPGWAVVNDRTAVTHFYEGLPPGEGFPWRLWIAPLFWWGTFLGAIIGVNLCLSVILRKQWMAHERLAFPVARALLELTGVSGTHGTLSSLVRSRFFLVGFAVTFLIICWFILTWFYVAVPPPPILSGNFAAKLLPLARGFPPFELRFSILTLVFGYFTNLEVLFSIWFFHVLAIVQAGVFNRVGLEVGSVDPWGSFHAAVGWQSFGGMIVFVGWGLWIARSHLRDVFRKAFRDDDRVDDTEELMSYRTAVWVMMGCSAYLLLWLKSAGMAWGPILSFYFATLVLYLGLARIMVESGLIFLRGPITAQAFTWHLFGVLGMGPGSAVILTLTNAFACDAKTFAMTPMAHVPRLGMAINRRLRKVLAPGVMLGALIGAATAVGFILYYGYGVMGSYNFGTVSFRGIGALNLAGFNRLAAGRIQAGTMGTSWDRIGFLGIGAAFTGLLFFLRYRFPGFPLHPIGFTISASAPLRNTTLTIFLVWALKTIVLRLGGLERYRRLIPLFLGMMVAYMAGTAIGVVVDWIWFHGQGHMIHVAW